MGSNSADEGVEERLINEEYKIWKKNTPFLYDLVNFQKFHLFYLSAFHCLKINFRS